MGEEDVDDQLKKLSLEELTDEDAFYEHSSSVPEDGKKQNKTWLAKAGKGILKRSGSLTKMFMGDEPKGGVSKEDASAVAQRVAACRSPMASTNGGVRIQDPNQAKLVRSVLSLMLKQMGSNLLKGKNMMNVSFPIECCQPKSILEIAAAQGGYFKHFLPKAAASKDPVERMRQVVACFVSSMILTSGNFLKPLNPLLGETLQVQYDDGSSAFLEQTCHHPPVSSFLLEGPQKLYRYYGYTTFEIGFGYNKMLLKNTGLRVLEFEDGGRIDIGFPADRWGNVFWGEMHHETLGEWDFTDEASGVRASIMFDADRKGSKIPSDSFVGFIERFSATDPDKDGTKVCTIEGSWVGYCDFDSQRYWDHAKLTRVPHASARSKLPSDSTNRADRNALEASDYKEAQAQKTALEEVQRAERKLRESGGGLGKKS